MPETNNSQRNDEAQGNEIALSEAERKVLDERDAEEAEAAKGATGAAGATADGATGATADGATGATGAAGATGSADDGATGATGAAGATAVAGANEPPPKGGVDFPTIKPGEVRDFAKELSALKTDYRTKIAKIEDDYDKSIIDDKTRQQLRDAADDAYESTADAVKEARTVATTESRMSKQFTEQTWEKNVDLFLNQAESDILSKSKHYRLLWQDKMQEVVDEAQASKTVLTDWQVLSAARDRLYKEAGLTPAGKVPGAAAAAGATGATGATGAKPKVKAPPLKDLPPSLRDAAGGSGGVKAAAEELAGLPIQEVEKYLAELGDGPAGQKKRDEILQQVNGRFED
jgi:hypothetical protein